MQELKQTKEEVIEIETAEITKESTTDTVKKVELEQLPLAVIREKLDAKGIRYKTNHNKKFLIKALLAGEEIKEKKEVKKAPTLEGQKKPTSLAIIPESIKVELEALAQRGLTWVIDEESCCINFMKDIPTCANLDQSANNILNTAKEAFGKSRPVEINHRKDMF